MKTHLAPILFLALSTGASGVMAVPNDHREFEATLNAPYRGEGGVKPDARTFTLSFDVPGLRRAQAAAWRLELIAPGGRRVARWQGKTMLAGRPLDVLVRWQGLLAGRAPAPGVYRVRLHAAAKGEAVDQDWEIAVGKPQTPAMLAFAPLPSGYMQRHAQASAAPAVGTLPYTVYYGNLHSQSNHSDGGGALDSCNGAQDPQSASFGPDAAFDYARAHGLDLLMVSEHNHMYDGSDGTNADADPARSKGLYQAGLQTARDANAAHPEFLALYGLEWGVISNGGHLNIFNSDELLGWENNAKGELLADTRTARSDYAALYTLMAQRGWIGQFNHPSIGGQFVVNGKALGYTPDGDAAMALCEVLNSSAFSTMGDESETRRSNYEQACNALLEAGYHVAFSSDQDNHCANWGMSYTNRTAVLIPNGVPLTRASFIDALRARRVFATMDRDAQLVLTANGHLMGERFDNAGPLALKVLYAGAPGRSAAAVTIVEGVPGRNGAVSVLSTQAETSVTPAPGAHFYYAKVTQDDGRVLWSAPVWVSQAAQ
ncbi:CehA/McbA family metallohydrolase [Massilia sp. 9096]|uniref:CehA/McbA family metallohydrolase n=1 Tax=Massilia sp. 9096 TaxID=1500894 RepID=UPI0005682903|nr:CehA/McbA family metallohydrolase [Massilia sp. 9096]